MKNGGSVSRVQNGGVIHSLQDEAESKVPHGKNNGAQFSAYLGNVHKPAHVLKTSILPTSVTLRQGPGMYCIAYCICVHYDSFKGPVVVP